MKITYIAWIGYHRRADLLAQHLGATVHHICFGRQGHLLEAPLRYLVQAKETWRTLCQERPNVIFVQNPPIFCAMVAARYARQNAARYVIDSHSGAFMGWKWRWSLPLHRRLSQNALVTIVHNRSQAAIVDGWGCRSSVIGFTPGTYPDGIPPALNGGFNIALVASFLGDEPIGLVFEAARQLPDVNFYVTGDSSRMPAGLLPKKPGNCFLTGYLPYDQYIGLLRAVDAIMVLTTRDHTLLMGGFEAVSLRTPLITSDWPILREYFNRGTVHVPNTVSGICEGARRAQADLADLQQGVLQLGARLEAEWQQKLSELQEVVWAEK